MASEHPENLFTMLADQFDLDVIETVTRLCPASLCDDELVDRGGSLRSPSAASPEETSSALSQLLTDAREAYRAMVSPDADATTSAQAFQNDLALGPEAAVAAADNMSSEGQFGLPQLSLQSVDDLIGSIERGQDPTLHFLHLLLPHGPYVYLPDGRRYTAAPARALKAVAMPPAGATRSQSWASPSSACCSKPHIPTG